MEWIRVKLETRSFKDLLLYLAHCIFNPQDNVLCSMPGVYEDWVQELISFNYLIPNVGAFTV